MSEPDPDRWRRIETILDSALGTPDADVDEILTRECGEDEELRRDVESRLSSGSPRTPPPNEEIPEAIGPYRIVREVGSGGMGVVYEAEQESPVRRRVALKLIKWGLDTREFLARFHVELQAMARMNHPNIAQVHDAGATAEGRPYLVMELVEGLPITRHCSRERLPTRARLELLLQVCDGVQHAHQKGVIHRDLKPTNVLVTGVDGVSVPKIIDFGVAKAVGPVPGTTGLHTRAGQVLGTPEYMSPEQAEESLDVDTRSDVYSVGVMLYELLVGVRPYEVRTKDGRVHRRIHDDEPPPPSVRLSSLGAGSSQAARRRGTDVVALGRELRGDLDWICLKALARERADRYGSPAALAEDIRRHLDGRPVLAGPPGAWYVFRKFARRNRMALVAIAAAAFGLAGTGAGLAVALVQSRKEQARTAAALAQAESVTRFLEGMLSAVEPSEMGRDVTMQEVLAQAERNIEGDFADQPLVEARLRGAIGRAYNALGDYAGAEPHLERAAALWRSAQGEMSEEAIAVADVLFMARVNQGRGDDAVPEQEAFLERARATFGPEHEHTLQAMVNLATAHVLNGRSEQAGELLDVVLPAGRRALPQDHGTLVSALGVAGMTYRKLGRLEEAESLYREYLETCRRLHGNEHPETINGMNNLGYFLDTQGRIDEAAAIYEEAIPLSRAVNGDEHSDTLHLLSNLGALYARTGRAGRADSLLSEAVSLAEKLYDENDFMRIALVRKYGACLIDMGRYDQAETVLLQATDGLERNFGASHTATQRAYWELARLYEAWGRPAEAARWSREREGAGR